MPAGAKADAPPRPAAAVRGVLWTGTILLLASPFVSNFAAYLEGRFSKPYLFLDVWLDLIWAATAFTTSATVLLSRTLLGETRRLLRIAVAFGFLLGSPFYYFALATPPAALYLRGMADAARQQVDLPRLQEWAAKTLKERPELRSSAGRPVPRAPLDWSKAPADARAYLGKGDEGAFFESISNRQIYIALRGAGGKVLVAGAADLMIATNRYWSCQLTPGIYLQHQLKRPSERATPPTRP